MGLWINRQVNGHSDNHVNHLEGKALGLQNLARGGKFWRDDEDIKAGLTMWEVVCKPVLNNGARFGPVPVKLMNRDWNEFKIEQGVTNSGRVLALSWSSSKRRIRVEKTEV